MEGILSRHYLIKSQVRFSSIKNLLVAAKMVAGNYFCQGNDVPYDMGEWEILFGIIFYHGSTKYLSNFNKNKFC